MNNDREQWFISRIGKVIHRTKTSCDCISCQRIYDNGLELYDEEHARDVYYYEMSGAAKYFDTVEERNEFENLK